MKVAWALQGVGYLLLGFILFFALQKNADAPTNTMSTSQKQLSLTSPAFQNGGMIPSKYTCDGDNISPPLAIEHIPENTASMVLIVDDPDAPNGTWDHWIVFNIPKEVTRVGEGSTPEGVIGKTSWNTTHYGGPCPPSGTHHYHFKLYALKTRLRLGEGASKEEILEAMKGHIIEESELLGTYARN